MDADPGAVVPGALADEVLVSEQALDQVLPADEVLVSQVDAALDVVVPAEVLEAQDAEMVSEVQVSALVLDQDEDLVMA